MNESSKYLKPLLMEFENNADVQRAAKSKAYLKGQFEFYGLLSKQRRDIQKEFLRKSPLNEDMLWPVIHELWIREERDCQHFAIDLLIKHMNNLKEENIEVIEELITTKSWWDSVDGLSTWICGAYFKLYPQQIKPITKKWMASGNKWLQRSCLLFQLKYKTDTDTKLLELFITELKNHPDFFIRKAIGWILREYSKTNPDWVRQLLNKVQLSGLSVREASKYL